MYVLLATEASFTTARMMPFPGVKWLPTVPEETTAKADQRVQSTGSKQKEPLTTHTTSRNQYYRQEICFFFCL
jgi:hypothetical protein